MGEDWTNSERLFELRRRAEAAIEESSVDQEGTLPENAQRLIHELRVHQIELEMQNEELRRTQSELEKSRDKFSDLYDSAPVGYFTTNREGRILGANLTGARLLGKRRNALIGQQMSHFVVREDEDIHYLNRLRVYELKNRQSCELRIVGRDGNEFHAELESVAVQDENGDLCNCHTVMIDVSERKKAEEMMKFKTLFENACDGIFISDMRGRVLEVNQVACESLGYSREELLQMTVTDIDCPDCAVPMTKRIEALQRNRRAVFEVDRMRKNGDIVPTELSSRLIEYGGNQAVLCIARDVTERKRMREEIQKAQRLESVGTLAGGIAHDFNNVLTAILGNISLARMQSDADRRSERLKAAEKACTQAKALTNQLLTFSRGGAPVKKTMSIERILGDSFTFALSGSNSKCRTTVPEELWPVEIDEGQINQVIHNLAINADEAMPAGGMIAVRAENVILEPGLGLPLEGGKYVRISVEDHGIGIVKEHLPRIFDPYFTTKQGGSGLGLATCYSIIKNHGGHIQAESVLGAGTTFSVYLPASPEASMTDDVEKAIEKPVPGKGKVLIMDDEELIRDSTRDMLSGLGYQVSAAADGQQTIELCKAACEAGQPYDVVVADLTIPGGMGGKEVVSELLEIDPGAKVVVSSGYSNNAVMANFREYGFKGIVAKPYSIEELAEVLQSLIAE